MPFAFIGHYGDVASRKVILSKADKVYIVTVGDIIENTYRVEKLEDNVVVLKYLPLNIDQSLKIGDAL
jgi:Tfp pilus assembly protein PilP